MAQSKARFLSSLLTSAGFVKDNRSLLAGSDGEIDLSSLPIIPNSQLEFSSVTLNELQVALGDSDQLRTDDIPEGSTNLYYEPSRADSDAKHAISVGVGLAYNPTTGVLDITETGVDSGVYGSASLVPILSVNPLGQIDSIGTVSVAGVSSINFDSGNGNFIINTADGGSFTETLTLDPYSTTNLVEGDNLYYTSVRTDSDARNAISVDGGLDYNVGTGILGHADTSTQVSVDNSNGNVIQDVSLDSYGHVTSLGSTDLDTRFVNLSGDTLTGFLILHADPTNAFHAVTKEYADNLAQGVKTAPSVRVATENNLVATYDNGSDGVGATLTSTSNGILPAIDGVSNWQRYDGILVKDQDSAAHNGRYFIDELGNDSNPWVLERCPFCDEDSEISGAYVFVNGGDTYEGTGWIQIVEDAATFTVGTDDITVTQFSGAGTFVSGLGIDLTDNVFSIDSSELLTILQDIDGAGSGIDADLLDGQEGSYYRINVYDASGILQN